jgi:hypothetical protein
VIEFRFILNPDTDNLEIEEPRDFAQIELSLIRDEKYHGIGFESTTGTLKFYGAAYSFLKTQKENYGLKSEVIFQALTRCEGETEYEEIIKGKLNFARYKETCGDLCEIHLPLEQEGCQFTFKNRFEQKVDLNNPKTFDGVTDLPNYAGLQIEMEIPPKAILAINEAKTEPLITEIISDQPDWFMTQGPDSLIGHIAPGFNKEVNSSFGSFNYASFPTLYNGGANNRPPYLMFPVTTNTTELLGEIECAINDSELSFRLKGSVAQVTSGSNLTTLRTKVFRLPVGADPSVLGNWVEEYSQDLAILNDTETLDFDQEATIPLTIIQGDHIYFSVFILVSDFSNIDSLTWNQDVESFIKIQASTLCESSDAEVNLVHETLSRVAEAITNYCVRVKSSYYGRTDSEPFFFGADGCGSLRMLTSGLKIRRAEEDKFFASMKELIEGLNPIDNIGFDIIPDPDRAGKFILRIEDVEFFYEDREMLSVPFIPESSREVEEGRHYATIKAGYKKWEVERINGLDEIHSGREYRTSLTAVSNTLDISSNLVAGSYAIESTRQQSFAASGGADTKYDNEIFILCVERNVYGYEAEQGNVLNAENIYSPSTIFNYRISPVRNLLRWYKSIISSYANYSDSTNKLYFGSGTGNLAASGEMESEVCKIEKSSAGYLTESLGESQNLFITHFQGEQYLPIWKNDAVPFEYPMSVKEYRDLKANPYGYISFQCGTGEYEKGFIKELKFKPVQGEATIILRKKWL